MNPFAIAAVLAGACAMLLGIAAGRERAAVMTAMPDVSWKAEGLTLGFGVALGVSLTCIVILLVQCATYRKQ